METAGGILTARSCVLTSLECSQNSVLKKTKQNKEDKGKKRVLTGYNPQFFLRRSEQGAWTLVRGVGDEHGARAGDDGKPK